MDQKWVRRQIKWLRDHEPWQDDLQLAADAAHIIDEARRRAIDAGRPDLAKLCQADWAIGVTRAQEILSALLEKPRQLTPPQAARRLGVSADTVRRWIETGELTAVNVGNKTRPRYRIEPEALDKLRRTTKQPPRKRRRKKTDLIVTRFSGRSTKRERGQ